jgi:outer membrane protein TolC
MIETRTVLKTLIGLIGALAMVLPAGCAFHRTAERSGSPSVSEAIAAGSEGGSATPADEPGGHDIDETENPMFVVNDTAAPVPNLLSDLDLGPSDLDREELLLDDAFPVDLPTILHLAGANNLQIALAAERVVEACAAVDAADALWIPSFSAGLIYNRHNGRIQATEGDVLDVSRGSLFMGAGLGLGDSPLNGPSGGPARMFVDLSLADVLFKPLAARQLVDVAAADEATVFNDTLFGAGLHYVKLIRAQAEAEIQAEAVANAENLVKITRDFANAGEGLLADTMRAEAAVAERRQNQLRAKEGVEVASAALVQTLRLDPLTQLAALDSRPVAVELVSESTPLEQLIAQGIAARPEVVREDANSEATWIRSQQECWRPWLPHLYAGFSGGGFGGNGNSDVKHFSDRTDFDLAAVWELENFGFGNAARRRQSESRHYQASLQADVARDSIAAQVRQAYHRVQLRRQQIEAVRPQVEMAAEGLMLNLNGIRGGELRPIEALQAISTLASARLNLVDATSAYNAAQLELLRAIGQPPYAE